MEGLYYVLGPLTGALAWLPLESEDDAVGSAALGCVEGRLRLRGTEPLWGPATLWGFLWFRVRNTVPDIPGVSKVWDADSC